MKRLALILSTVVTASLAHADLVIDESAGLVLDVAASTGSGSSTAYAVFDFGATGGASHALAYAFDGEATVHDMLLAFETNLGLVYDWTDWGSGIFADNFALAGDTGEATLYWAHSLASPDGSGTVEWSDAWAGAEATSLADGLISGWYNGFNEDYSAIPPSLPLVTVPAPGAAAMLALLAVARRRRR